MSCSCEASLAGQNTDQKISFTSSSWVAITGGYVQISSESAFSYRNKSNSNEVNQI